MTANKIVKTMEPIKLDVTGVTLPTWEDVKKVPDRFLSIGQRWWLQTAGEDYRVVKSVDRHGFIGNANIGQSYGVRPVLIIKNIQELALAEGDELELAEHTWTVIHNNMALCNDIVGISE